jgi:hypothetical protein
MLKFYFFTEENLLYDVRYAHFKKHCCLACIYLCREPQWNCSDLMASAIFRRSPSRANFICYWFSIAYSDPKATRSVIASLFVRWLQVSRFSQLLYIGVLWLLLTVVFEMVLGRLIFDYSWSQIAADYNLLQGGLMPIGLVLLTLAPFIAAKIRGVLPDRTQQNI